jgi:aspartate aminotransferase
VVLPILRFSSKTLSLLGEGTLEFQDLADQEKRKGRKIINFGIGQPDFVTPKHIINEAINALEQGFTGYTPSSGIDELREAISKFLNERYNANVVKGNIIVTPGAKMALYLALQSYIDYGDEVIIPEPSYYSYAEVTRMLGGKPVFSPLSFSTVEGFKLNLEDIENKISDRTKAIVLNNPHNPTGAVFDKKEIIKLIDLVKERNLILISDEIYDNYVYDEDFYSVLNDNDWKSNIIYVNGLSKTFCMTGWRLGFVAAHEEVIKRMKVIAANTYTCPNSFSQKGALAAYYGNWDVIKEIINTFKKRRDVIYNMLTNIKDITLTRPKGAFYIFPNMSKIMQRVGLNSREFAIKLIREAGVVTIPGTVFPDKAGEGFIRLSYAVNEGDIEEGMKRLKDWINEVMS